MRVGLLVDAQSVARWKADAVQQLLSELDAEVTLVVENADSAGLEFYLNRIADDGVWALAQGVDLLRRQLDLRPSYREPVDLRTVMRNADANFRRCEPISDEGFGVELPAEIVDEVRTETDVVVRFGFGIITGDILSAPEYGVLSYHHGNIRSYRGRPPGFWEFMNDEPSVGITVQKLTEVLDGGGIAAEKSVEVSDAQTWQEVKARLFTQSDDLLLEAVENVVDDDVTEIEEVGPLYTAPDTIEYGRYLWKNWVR